MLTNSAFHVDYCALLITIIIVFESLIRLFDCVCTEVMNMLIVLSLD